MWVSCEGSRERRPFSCAWSVTVSPACAPASHLFRLSLSFSPSCIPFLVIYSSPGLSLWADSDLLLILAPCSGLALCCCDHSCFAEVQAHLPVTQRYLGVPGTIKMILKGKTKPRRGKERHLWAVHNRSLSQLAPLLSLVAYFFLFYFFKEGKIKQNKKDHKKTI